MVRRIKQNVQNLWQSTASVWKDNVATQYQNGCISIVEELLDRISTLNSDLDHKIEVTMRSVEKYEYI